jgi:hypothetical protein
MKPLLRKIASGVVLGAALLGLLSCGTVPLFLNPTPTVPLLSQTVTLASSSHQETGQVPAYTLTAQTPVLEGSSDRRVEKFNREAAALVQAELEAFKQNLQSMPPVPVSAGSSFDMRYTLVSPPGEVLSLKFGIDAYVEGAAHPYHLTHTLTYDLQKGRDVSLDQLFLPGSDYLAALADYCKAELGRRDIAFDASNTGADPTPENYRNWNITPQGLLITFDEYQVAAYAAGHQDVVIPYRALQTIIDPNGPLAGFRP